MRESMQYRNQKKSLELAIEASKPGNTIGDIGYAVQSYAEKKTWLWSS